MGAPASPVNAARRRCDAPDRAFGAWSADRRGTPPRCGGWSLTPIVLFWIVIEGLMDGHRATLLGSATLAWVSDYGQFYLVDPADEPFVAPTKITSEMMRRGFFAAPSGLVVYTNDSLQQRIDLAIYDGEPAHPATEPMSGAAWTRVEQADLHFPSRSFGVSSPSHPPRPFGPVFHVGSELMRARIAWKEFEGSRDDSVPVEPDVIAVSLWPRP